MQRVLLSDPCKYNSDPYREGEMKKAHVICCNDSVEAVYIGDEENTGNIIVRMRQSDYDRKKRGSDTYRDPHLYGQVFFWHYHTVNIVDDNGSTK